MTRRGQPPAPVRVPVRHEVDVAIVRLVARELALQEDFPPGRAAALATAVSEVAMNIVVHAATPGEVALEVVEEGGRRGIVAVARDDRPGIPDVAAAMEDGYSTSRGLGLGLAAARRLADELTLASGAGGGTTVTIKKWAHAIP